MLPKPIADPGQRDFIICGSARSGTTLLAAMLHQPPSITAVVEPWDGLRLPPADLFGSLRQEIDQTGEIRRGRLDLETLSSRGAVQWSRDGEKPHPVNLESDYLLGVKWPVFWRFLSHLPNTKFLVCVRHPDEVVASFEQQQGTLSLGLDYPMPINYKMNRELREATSDIRIRRMLMYEYVNSRIAPHLDRSQVFKVPYERWFIDPRNLLEEIGQFLGVQLTNPLPVLQRSEAPHLDAEEYSLVRRICTSAGRIGYEL